ncbi:MAG TPA: hypothetical protein VIL20_08875 [Sandaracinaceae bacterium]
MTKAPPRGDRESRDEDETRGKRLREVLVELRLRAVEAAWAADVRHDRARPRLPRKSSPGLDVR